MKRILVLQNKTRKKPGFIFEEVKAAGFDYHVVDISQEDSVPDLSDFHAMIVLGGRQSVNDNDPQIEREIQIVRDWLQTKKLYLGICLGM